MAFTRIPIEAILYDAAGNPVDTAGGLGGTITSASGTITIGGTAQAAVAANTARNYLFIRNPIDATEALWVNLTGTATAASPSVRLDAGDHWEFDGSFIPTNAVSVIAATTGHAFTIWEG